MTQKSILESTAKKHVKIYLLSTIGIKNAEIAKLTGTNVGHVWNVLNDYKTKPGKVEAALAS